MINRTPYERGLLVFVPFPFSDLSQVKQRPAVIISPSSFSGDNVISCAISSRNSPSLKPWEVVLNTTDTQNERLPKDSVIKVDKLFNMHSSHIIRVLDSLKAKKQDEVMSMLRSLFS